MKTNYKTFKQADESTHLGQFINIVFKKLSFPRIITAPQTFIRKDSKKDPLKEKNALVFYELCLAETYLHSIPKNLHQWKEKAEEYNQEFQSSRKYYASSRRLELIHQYGGEEDDYNPDGTIKTDVDENILTAYSLINELVPDDQQDIFLQTEPVDLSPTIRYILANSEMDITEMIKTISGKEIKTYRIENGEMIENDWADNLLRKASDKEYAISISLLLLSLATGINILISDVHALDKTSDNKDFFQALPGRIQNIFDMKIELLDITKIITKKE